MTHNIAPALLDRAVAVGKLTAHPGNARTRDARAEAALEASLERNGQYRTVVARTLRGGKLQILAGHGTVEAARRLGWSQVAVDVHRGVDDEAAARIVLVDNRTSDLAGYDDALLAQLLGSLEDLHGTGFDDDDLAALLAGVVDDAPALNDVDDAPALPELADAVSQRGDVWLLGPHRLWCGDSTNAAGVAGVLAGDQPDVVWTDPPYGVSYVGKTSEALTIENDGKADLPALLPAAFRTIAGVCRPGAPVYVAHADTERILFEQSMLDAGLLVRQNLVWVKSTLVMGRSDYHYKHEPVLEAVVPDVAEVPAEDEDAPDVPGLSHEPVLYGFAPGGQGRLGRGGERWHGDNKQTTVFEFPKPHRNGEHPTMKPVDLILAMLRNSCPPGGLLLDLFGGSGSTLIAAHHMRAKAFLVELDRRYVDVICRRWQEHTGIAPVRQADGAAVDFTSVGAMA